jgi:hypothetical protein
MTELRRWLDDQVRQGLAGGRRSFETMAARLVDAQAPTAANAVRRLGFYAGVGPNWADRLLGELSLLSLLVSGYERLADLPPELAATVRSRIGFQVAADDVLAGPRVADRWQVLGQVETDDGALTTRRTWLHASAHDRFALVLSFAAAGQTMVDSLMPGTEFRGELAFYPGAAPLRALVASRDSAAERFGSPDGAKPLVDALAGWSSTVAAEPWRYDAPVLLEDVRPTDDGWLVDTTGASLPLAPGHREPWWLLAAAGGRPATVAAEWSPSGLRPLAAWVHAEFVPAATSLPGPTVSPQNVQRGPELPPTLLAAALVGTNRRPWTGDGSLLDAAAVALIRQRAGVTPASGHEPVSPSPDETDVPLPPAAGSRLLRILGEGVPGGAQLAQELLVQWLEAAAERGGHVPPVALPDLLDAGRRNSIVRPALARVAGRRGTWLAARRSDWRWLRDEALPGSPADWETGSSGERLGLLTALRETDPARGRELLESTWAQDSSDDRTRFVAALATGLTIGDDAFLERALDDRRKEVREAALELLRRLPGSALGARMAERARAAVRFERPDRLTVTPPAELDAALRRDGVAATPARGLGVSAWLLEEVLTGTPLSTWADPATMLRLARHNDWETALLHGWAKAAVAQDDAAWASVLLSEVSAALRESVRWDLHLVLPPSELGRLAAEALRKEDPMAHRLLAIHPGNWPEELSVAVLETIAHRARNDRHTWQLGELCRAAALAMPPEYADMVARLALQLDQEPATSARVRPIADLARALAFRQDMFAELRSS